MTEIRPTNEDLIATNEEFRLLAEDHRRHEERLAEILGRDRPSVEDELEMKRIKVHKLAVKDRMEQIRRNAVERSRATA